MIGSFCPRRQVELLDLKRWNACVMAGHLRHPGHRDSLPQRRATGSRGEELHPHVDRLRLTSHLDLRVDKEVTITADLALTG